LDFNSLAEVRTLAALPSDVADLLGRQGGGAQAGIADAGKAFNHADTVDPHLPMRRFIVGGSSLAKVLVAYEQGGRSDSIHAAAFVLERSGWRQAAAWTLTEKPTSVRDLILKLFPQRWTTRPNRRDGPLRARNISDDEVLEIESIIRQAVPGATTHISGVVTGCPCEDGPNCSEQVWIVAYTPEQSRGLELSRISGRWSVGPAQQWWLDYDNLQARRESFPSISAFSRAQIELSDRFPVCATSTSHPEPVAQRASLH
jgi:hypothetical protein